MELRLGIGGKSIQARGMAVVLVMLALTSVAAVWTLDHYQTLLITEQHRALHTSLDRTSCMVAMSPEDRVKFRSEYRPGAFRQWCPWVNE
jgi:hypothetical protein